MDEAVPLPDSLCRWVMLRGVSRQVMWGKKSEKCKDRQRGIFRLNSERRCKKRSGEKRPEFCCSLS